MNLQVDAIQRMEITKLHRHVGHLCDWSLAHLGQTMLVVTHEIGFARRVASRVLYMDRGAIIEEGLPEDVIENPSEERTRQFLSKVLRFGSD